MMKSVSALSAVANTDVAIESVVAKVARGLAGERADLAVLFSSSHHADALDRVARALGDRAMTRHVIGCTGESIVGEDREIEGEAALSLFAIQLPGMRLTPRRLELDEPGINRLASELRPSDAAARPPTLLVLGDPFSFPADEFLKALNAGARGVPVVGGMASASGVPRGNRLLLDDDVYDDGAVAIEIDGPIQLRTVVSQGCRPIGRPLIVTRAERNVIAELGRRNALEVLKELFEELPPEDQELVQHGLHIGRVINEYQETFRRGDFLVRNVMGADEAGGIAVTDVIKVGQTVQFHVRDSGTADEDLRSLLEAERRERPNEVVRGALLFTCNGRGTRLFDAPNHDVGVIHELLGPVPVAGFFAMGELGPVGGQNFVHGFTASVVLFTENVAQS